MFLAYEFGDVTLDKVTSLNPEMVGWWLAFFKRKNQLENPSASKRGSKTTPPPRTRRAKAK